MKRSRNSSIPFGIRDILIEIVDKKILKVSKAGIHQKDLLYHPKIKEVIGLIRVVDFTGSGLRSIPNQYAYLSNLKKFILPSNIKVPNYIQKLPNLKRISIKYIQGKFSKEILGFVNIQHLHLLEFQDYPEGIFSFPQLKSLTLENCAFVPKSLQEHSNIKDIKISGKWLITNDQQALAKTLKHAETLNISNNYLKTFPNWVLGCKKLRALDISKNKIKEIPKSIHQLKNLQVFHSENNPIRNVPIEVLQRGIRAICNYFENISQQGVDYLYEIKLILVGQGRVGKTSLTKKLSIPNYQLESEQRSTEGIDVKTWKIPKEEFQENSPPLPKDFQVNIWDFGGQEIYHSTHQFFLTRRSLYIIVAESRQETSNDEFYYWLNLIKILSNQSPVLITLNKCDQPTKELPIKNYQDNFSNIQGFNKISCANGWEHSIETLKKDIKNILSNRQLLPHIGTPLPKDWVKLRVGLENLFKKNKDHITLETFLHASAKVGMDKEKALWLSNYLHDIGIILHFQDDLLLREIIILNHEWVTKGVYKVLDNEKVKKQRGRFTNDDLLLIWSEEKWRDKINVLLALMKKFDLCFEIENGKYLSPQLLPPDEIDYIWPSYDNNLKFEYHYAFMPKGLISRLIVKMNLYIFQESHWLHGVILDYEDTRALIQEEFFKKRLSIRLHGPYKEKFLYIILKAIEEIHSSFHNLEVKKMVPCNCSQCQVSREPFFFEYSTLKKCREKNKEFLVCGYSVEDVEVNSLIENLIPVVSGKLRKDDQTHIQIYNTIDRSQIDIENHGEMAAMNVGKGSQGIAGSMMSASTDIQNELVFTLTNIQQDILLNTVLTEEARRNALSFLDTLAEEIEKSQPEFRILNMAANALKNSLTSLATKAELLQSVDTATAKILQLYAK
ncbi:MAG: COR domain-containing protein [Spirochaetota bacterium]